MIPKRSVLYLHGFASSPRSQKAVAMRALLERVGFEVRVPDLNQPSFAKLDFNRAVDTAVAAAEEPSVIVGSSMGCLIALEAAARGVIAPMVLIAPAIGIREHFLSGIPEGDPVAMMNHVSGRKELVHRHFFEQVSSLTVDLQPPPARVTVFMGTADETLPFDLVKSQWEHWQRSGRLRSGSRFVAIAGGDHGLNDHVEEFAREVVRLTTAETIP